MVMCRTCSGACWRFYFTAELCGSNPNPVQRKVEFKRLNTGHSNLIADMIIAAGVQHLRDVGHSYTRAIKKVAEAFGLDERHVKRIYSKHKGSALNQSVDNIRHGIRSMNSCQFWEIPAGGGVRSTN
jgi:hypothetical protein